VDFSKEEVSNTFEGNNNEQDVFNTQLAVLNKLIQKLRAGSLYRDKYQVVGDVNIEPFTDRFENEMAGWTATFDVMIQNDIDVC
jgi:exonuclease III